MNSFLTRIIVIIFALGVIASCDNQPIRSKQAWAIIVHGGAGSIEKKTLTSEKELAYQNALQEALNIGKEVLKNNGTALDAVEKTIRYMEDNPLFNSGKGAVLTHEKKAELDASIMDGSNLNAGAVASVSTIKHPISGARTVMEKSPHVLLMGAGAEAFAVENKLEIVENSYFITPKRLKQIESKLKSDEDKHGTVGVVALDKSGNLAAGTSTGGMMNKSHGRVGDSPIIGAGTYADNSSCGVSCTGHGEYFIRLAIAHDISEMMKLKKMSVEEASDIVIHQKLEHLGGKGGIIALDPYGDYAWPFNTNGMFRAYANASGVNLVKMFK